MANNDTKQTVNPTEQDGAEMPNTEPKTAAEAEGVKEDNDAAQTIALLQAQIKDKDDRYLRMAAEYDNFRRRSREEKEATYDRAVFDTVEQLLPFFDTLERAAQFDDGDKVKEGLLMLLKTTTEILTKMGITAFGEAGEVFDPKLHNAVMHVEDDTLGEGVITDVFQKGYKKENKILRFAVVKIAN